MRYICAIDIGSSKIAACLGAFSKRRQYHDLWWDSIDWQGFKKGELSDPGAFSVGVERVLKNLKAKSGVNIKSAYLGIVSQNIIIQRSCAVIPLTEIGNKVVSQGDIQRVCQQAHILGTSLEQEVIYEIPLGFSVDNASQVLNPLGLYGRKLAVDLYLISIPTSNVNAITKAINHSGIRLDGLVLSGFAISRAVFNPRAKNGLTILCDIGGDITQILIFKDARLVNLQILPLGGDDLTVSLSKGLNIPYSLAEEVKLAYGSIQDNLVQDKEILIKDGNGYRSISQNLIIQILTQAARRIAQAIRDALKVNLLAISSQFSNEMPLLFASGRTTMLEGFLELLETEISISVNLAKIGNSQLQEFSMKHHNLPSQPSILNYLACLGLILEVLQSWKRDFTEQRGFANILFKFPLKIKEIYQEYF